MTPEQRLAELGLTLPDPVKPVAVYVDPRDGSVPPEYVFENWLATTSYPANWMVFKDGKVHDTKVGLLNKSQLTQMLDRAV